MLSFCCDIIIIILLSGEKRGEFMPFVFMNAIHYAHSYSCIPKPCLSYFFCKLGALSFFPPFHFPQSCSVCLKKGIKGGFKGIIFVAMRCMKRFPKSTISAPPIRKVYLKGIEHTNF